MKNYLSILFCLVCVSVLKSQQVIPMSKSKDLYQKYVYRHTIASYENLYIDSVEIAKKILNTNKEILKIQSRIQGPSSLNTQKYTNKLSDLRKDSTELAKEDLKYRKYYEKNLSLMKAKADTARRRLDSLEENVFIYGFGSADAVSQSSITSNGGFSFGANIHPWDRFFLSIGLGASLTKTEKQDSININSIFFPDNGNSVINAHYEISTRTIFHLLKYKRTAPSIHDNFSDDILIYGQAAMQNRNIQDTNSAITNYGVYNLGVGIIYRWTKNSNSKNKFCFDLGLGYGYVEIAKQSKQDFQSIINTDLNAQAKIPMIYRGLNILASVQYNDLVIYARIFSEISKGGVLTGYDNRVYFSTGIKVTGVFFSF